MTQKKKNVLILLLFWGIMTMLISIVCIGFGVTTDGSALSEPIEFTVASQYYRGDGTLFLTASEFESPRFYIVDSSNRGAVEKSVGKSDKITVRVYNYNDGHSEFHIGEVQKDGETVFSDISSGSWTRIAYLFTGMGLLVTVACTALYIKSARTKMNVEEKQ